MRYKFARRRGESAQAAYEPRTEADWREEQRLIAAQDAQRLQRAAANKAPPASTHPPGAAPCAD